jgi:hypothetical protein
MQPEIDLIDRVARAMTDAEPGGDFRVRVIANLPAARPQPLWHYAAIACSGLALGMLIMIGGIGRNSATQKQTSAPAPAANRTAVTPNRASGAATPVSTSQRRGPTGPTGPTGPIGPIGPNGPTGFFVPVGPREGAFEVLSLSPIQPSDLSIAPIVVRPMTTGTLGLPVVDGNVRKK